MLYVIIGAAVGALLFLAASALHRKKIPGSFDELLPLLYPDGVELSQEQIIAIMEDDSAPEAPAWMSAMHDNSPSAGV